VPQIGLKIFLLQRPIQHYLKNIWSHFYSIFYLLMEISYYPTYESWWSSLPSMPTYYWPYVRTRPIINVLILLNFFRDSPGAG
jgi:hypothetical protein